MNTKQFFIARGVVFGALLLIGLAYVSYITLKEVKPQDDYIPPVYSGIPTFSWQTEQATTTNPDGIPKVHVFVEATYKDGKVDRKLADTADGGCNQLEESEPDSVEGTKSFQCYAAGFGYRYKIVKTDAGYEVQRKGFEESTPEQTPQEYSYEKVAEFTN